MEIAPQGAHVLAWEPAGTPPVLFLSPRSFFAPGKAIRGGVPLVFPWFGPKAGDPNAAQHGFARVRDWTLVATPPEPDGAIHVTLTLDDDDRTRAVWPHAFAARFCIRAGRTLEMGLEVRNSGETTFSFEAALHTYFAVSDVGQIVIRGLEPTEYVERYGGGGRQRPAAEPITFTGEVDRTYFDTTADCVIVDPGWKRRIVVAKSGSHTTVVWNPGSARARHMADLGDPAWRGFVCVETVCAGADAVTLSPGATHVLGATIAVEQD